MNLLYNKYSNKVLKNFMFMDTIPRITVSFYKYCVITDPYLLRDHMYTNFHKLKIFGRIYIATEGINAQISIPKIFYLKTLKYIKECLLEFKDLNINQALNNKKSFWVLRIKVKTKILSDGLSMNFFNSKNTGTYLSSIEVNEMIDKEDVIFLDIRNNYEYKIGHFDGAINIPVNTFREQLFRVVKFLNKFKNKKIVMYCTGGIRCEKSTAWIKYHGFKRVYQIKGGIIKYVNDSRKYKLPIRFKGKNFVFDERMSEIVTKDILSKCSQCNIPCDDYVNCINKYCNVLFIQCKTCNAKFQKCCSLTCINQHHTN